MSLYVPQEMEALHSSLFSLVSVDIALFKIVLGIFHYCG